MTGEDTYARWAYAAYGETTGGLNYQGLPMPDFDDLGETIQLAWSNAAAVVRAGAPHTEAFRCRRCGAGHGSRPELLEHLLYEVLYKEGKIMSEQDDVNAAAAAINTEVLDLEAKDEAIAAAQQQLLAALGALPAGVDTSALVAATASLLTAAGADDATVAALTAAANAAATPAPAPSGDESE